MGWFRLQDTSREPPFLEAEALKDLLSQLSKHVSRYPGSGQIIFVFDSQYGAIPPLIRKGPEEAGALVRAYP